MGNGVEETEDRVNGGSRRPRPSGAFMRLLVDGPGRVCTFSVEGCGGRNETVSVRCSVFSNRARIGNIFFISVEEYFISNAEVLHLTESSLACVYILAKTS